jgi:hypothetical protein
MRDNFAKEQAVDDLVGAIRAGAPGPAFEALDRLIDDRDDADQLRERIAIARTQRR